MSSGTRPYLKTLFVQLGCNVLVQEFELVIFNARCFQNQFGCVLLTCYDRGQETQVPGSD